MNKNLSKGELVQVLAEAELKILNLKKKNKKLQVENKELQYKYDDLLDEYNAYQKNYERD